MLALYKLYDCARCSDTKLSWPDFSSQDGTYYNPNVGKPTPNPEQQVTGPWVQIKQA